MTKPFSSHHGESQRNGARSEKCKGVAGQLKTAKLATKTSHSHTGIRADNQPEPDVTPAMVPERVADNRSDRNYAEQGGSGRNG